MHDLTKIALITFTATVAAVAIVASSGHAKAATVCGVEVSTGVGVTQDHLSSAAGGSLDLSQTGGLIGGGVGCDLRANDFVSVGAMARYSWMKSAGDVFNAAIKSNNLVEVAAKFSAHLTPKSSGYGLVGWSWENLDLSAVSSTLGTKTPNGLMLGAGLEHQLYDGPWFVRGEYTWHHFQSIDAGGATSLNPDLHVARAAVVYKFGSFDEGVGVTTPAHAPPMK